MGDFTRNSYLGYSASAGHVIDSSGVGDVVTGAPRGNELNGHAVLYQYKVRAHRRRQLGHHLALS